MIRTSVVLAALAAFFMLSTPARAQVSGETESGTDGRGGSFVSQYVFYDWKDDNLLVRYFWVNGAVNRAEVAFGPTFKTGNTVTKLQFGATTAKEAMAAVLIISKVGGRQLMYIGDFKPAMGHLDYALYQKFFWAIDTKSVWQFRIEALNINRGQAFLRIGGEYQLQFDPKHHLYVAPFYDPVVKAPGVQFGFRFF